MRDLNTANIDNSVRNCTRRICCG